MNEYKFENFQIGTAASFEVVATEKMMTEFGILSGDYNPMHINEEYAQKQGFDSKIVYGMLTSSFYSKLVGMYLPGKYCLLQGIEVIFKKPVYINDTLKVEGIVAEKDERFKNAKIKAKVINQDGGVVSKATIMVGFYE